MTPNVLCCLVLLLVFFGAEVHIVIGTLILAMWQKIPMGLGFRGLGLRYPSKRCTGRLFQKNTGRQFVYIGATSIALEGKRLLLEFRLRHLKTDGPKEHRSNPKLFDLLESMCANLDFNVPVLGGFRVG